MCNVFQTSVSDFHCVQYDCAKPAKESAKISRVHNFNLERMR